jgi:hypothetical protein
MKANLIYNTKKAMLDQLFECGYITFDEWYQTLLSLMKEHKLDYVIEINLKEKST